MPISMLCVCVGVFVGCGCLAGILCSAGWAGATVIIVKILRIKKLITAMIRKAKKNNQKQTTTTKKGVKKK